MMTVPIVIAFEASGFGRGSYPVEVGFLSVTAKAGAA
jgi:hypothetical protein